MKYMYADEKRDRVLVIDSDGVSRKTMDSREVTAGEHIAEPVPKMLKDVPRVITMRQARRFLHEKGLLVSVQQAIDSLEEPPRIAAQIEWDYSSTMERHNTFVAMISGYLGMTNDEVDDMFIEASKL